MKLLAILSEPAYFGPLAKGTAAGTEHTQLLRELCCNCVVDIGANRGQFALVARKCLPNARVISFEPLHEPAMIFRKVFVGDAQVTLHEMAIGPEEQQVSMHVSCEDDSSSILPISNLQTSLFPGTAEKETRRVIVKPLDAVMTEDEIHGPALLKIDVQGFEREVLKGCVPLLRCFTYVYVECSFMELYTGQALAPEIIDQLRGFGFSLRGLYNLAYDRQGRAVQGDFLFEK